jgi:hypothetical protein
LHVGENLVWSGVPDARRAAVAAIPETLLPGILFGGVGLHRKFRAMAAAFKIEPNASD